MLAVLVRVEALTATADRAVRGHADFTGLLAVGEGEGHSGVDGQTDRPDLVSLGLRAHRDGESEIRTAFHVKILQKDDGLATRTTSGEVIKGF
jgi:hypothetical protein